MRHEQVWNWNKLQRKSDSFMNKAYIFSCRKLTTKACLINSTAMTVLDIGAGSGLVLRHLSSILKSNFTYTALDINEDGLKMLSSRAVKLGIHDRIITDCSDISISSESKFKSFDMIISNFCLYTIIDNSKRASSLRNISLYLKDNGSFHIALPSENYSAFKIAMQSFKDEWADKEQGFISCLIRSLLLVPYQLIFVLRPIEKQINSGKFLRFSKNKIEHEFKNANLAILELSFDYGGCGYHIHGKKLL